MKDRNFIWYTVNMETAKQIEKIMQEGVLEAIKDSHQRGFPAYQYKDGYIIALYPDGRIVKLEKSLPLSENPKLCRLLFSQL